MKLDLLTIYKPEKTLCAAAEYVYHCGFEPRWLCVVLSSSLTEVGIYAEKCIHIRPCPEFS